MVNLGFPIWVAALASIGYVRAQSLSEAVASSDDLSLLGQLLKGAPKAAQYLSSLKDVTVFAPNNAAFKALIQSGAIDPSNIDPTQLEAILRYHFAKGAVTSDQVMEVPAFLNTYLMSTFTLQGGEMIGSNVTGGQVVEVALDGKDVVLTSGLKQTSTVVTPDVKFDNGVVHIIDTVLTVPESASDTALAADLTALAGALDATGLIPTVDGLKDVTIFAPINEAFEAIGSALAGASPKTLKDVLTYHVISGTVGYSVDLKPGAIKTVQGNDVTISIEDGAVFVNAARVINADVLIAGGVLHVIDSVLNPNDASAQPDPSATSATVEYPGSSVGNLPFTTALPMASTTVSQLTATTTDVAAGLPTSGASGTTGAGASSTPSGAANAVKGGAGLAVAAGVFVAGMI